MDGCLSPDWGSLSSVLSDADSWGRGRGWAANTLAGIRWPAEPQAATALDAHTDDNATMTIKILVCGEHLMIRGSKTRPCAFGNRFVSQFSREYSVIQNLLPQHMSQRACSRN